MTEGNKISEHQNSRERGAVMIIEATFVFPIMFIIVFIMIMAGNAYYQHARVERAVTEAAISGAARCENPMLDTVISDKAVPKGTSAVKVMPYRYLFTGNTRSISNQVADRLRETINHMDSLAFRGMEPKNVSVSVKPKLYVIVSSLEITCEFDVILPIRMLFSNENVKFHYTVSMTEPIGDPAEFVRNVSTVQDIMNRSETASNIAQEFANVTGKLAEYIN